MRGRAQEHPQRLACGKRLDERVRRGVRRLASRRRAADQDATSQGASPEPSRPDARTVREIHHHIGHSFERHAPDTSGGQVGHAERSVAAHDDGPCEDARLSVPPHLREEDLARVAADLAGREAQRRISSTASTWTPFSLR